MRSEELFRIYFKGGKVDVKATDRYYAEVVFKANYPTKRIRGVICLSSPPPTTAAKVKNI